MFEVKLYTKDGEFVTAAIIPPLVDAPEIVLWGTRIFKLYVPSALGRDDREPGYYETWAAIAWSEEEFQALRASQMGPKP